MIDTTAGEAETVALALNEKPKITTADVLLGQHDVIAVVEAADAEAVARVVLNEITTIDKVIHTTTCLVVSTKTGRD